MQTITRDELAELAAAPGGARVVLTLGPLRHELAHIPGSETFADLDEALGALDPADDIVLYCSHEACSSSRAAHRLLVDRGFRSVRRYAGGLADWAAARLPLHEETGCGPRCGATADVRAEVAA
jgi:rhodanese-related sulfurtransferase